MPSFRIFAATAALLVSAPALADDVKVAIGIIRRQPYNDISESR